MPTISNHLAVGINMQHQTTITVGQEMGWSQKLGLTNIANGSFPRVTMSPYDIATQNGGHGNQFPQNVIPIRDTVSVVRGKQSLKFGGVYAKFYENSVNLYSASVWGRLGVAPRLYRNQRNAFDQRGIQSESDAFVISLSGEHA